MNPGRWLILVLTLGAAMPAPARADPAEGCREAVGEPSAWVRRPGPGGIYELAGCRGDVLKLPRATTPTVAETAWNGCVRACADRLRQCQRPCRQATCDAGCQEVFDACKAGCGQPAGAATSSGPSVRESEK